MIVISFFENKWRAIALEETGETSQARGWK